MLLFLISTLLGPVQHTNKLLPSRFGNFSLEHHVNCSFDWLELRNGPGPNGSLITSRLCGGAQPPVRLISSQNWLFIHLHTDASVSTGGFLAHLTASVGPAAGCGGAVAVTDEQSTLESPRDDAGKYLRYLHCVWRLSTQPGRVINVQVANFHLEGPPNNQSQHCYDLSRGVYLEAGVKVPSFSTRFPEVRDGLSVSSTPIYNRLCGRRGAMGVPLFGASTQHFLQLR